MKLSITLATAIAAIGMISAPAIADNRPTPKGPVKTMGDQGTLPANDAMRNATPEMTGPNDGNASTGASTGESGSAAPNGPSHRMGDEAGKLPATGTVSDRVPDMRGPASGDK